VALAGWAAWDYARCQGPNSRQPSLIVDWPGPNMGELEIGSREITVSLTNPTDQPHRIIGMRKWCGWNCCIKPKSEDPMTVPARGKVAYPLVLESRFAGAFEVDIILYLEDNDTREVTHTLRGVAVTPRDQSHAKGG